MSTATWSVNTLCEGHARDDNSALSYIGIPQTSSKRCGACDAKKGSGLKQETGPGLKQKTDGRDERGPEKKKPVRDLIGLIGLISSYESPLPFLDTLTFREPTQDQTHTTF